MIPMNAPPAEKGSVLRADLSELLSFFAPVFIEQLCISICSLITSSTLGGLGTAEVSAFNLVETLNVFLMQVMLAMGTGTAVVVSQYRGKNDAVGAGRVAVQALYFLVGISILLMGGILIFHRPILNLVLGKAEPVVYNNGRIFLMTSTCSLPIFMTYSTCVNAVRGSGYPRRTMPATILTNGSYAFFSWLFVRLGMGMYSPGIALMVARLAGSSYGLMLIRHGNPHLHIPSLRVKKLDFSLVRKVLFIGIPISIEGLIFQGGRLLTQTMVVPFGTNAMAANGIANNMSNLMLVPGSTFQLSLVPIVGKFIGSDNIPRARSTARTGVILASMMHAVTCLAAFLLRDAYIGLYHQPEAVNEIIRSLFRPYYIMMPLFWATSFVLPNALRAAGDVRHNMIGSVGSMILFRLVLSYVFTKYTSFGVNGIWYAMYVDWLVRCTWFVLRFRGDKWTKMKVV